jgi:peptidoglycan/xylan/chitin deacetylase (PgdA/CDA1 family)
VLTYHRIGNAAECLHDSDIFSATSDELDEHVRFLKRGWHISTLEEVLEVVEGTRRLTRPSVLFTFDDGYRDNHSAAYPILASHGVQGVFFLTTGYVGTQLTPWWDRIAYIIKSSKSMTFELRYPSKYRFDINQQGIDVVIRKVLQLYKSSLNQDEALFLNSLEEACDTARPNEEERCIMNWGEAAEMLSGGMAIGSHTHSHRILSKLSAEEQLEEMLTSKQLLEARLNTKVQSIAYPVGGPDTFTDVTRSAAEKAGYRIAFSYYGGVNVVGSFHPYDVARVAVYYRTAARFKLDTTLTALMGRSLF